MLGCKFPIKGNSSLSFSDSKGVHIHLFKSVFMKKKRQEAIVQLKPLISLKLGTNVGFGKKMIVTKQ